MQLVAAGPSHWVVKKSKYVHRALICWQGEQQRKQRYFKASDGKALPPRQQVDTSLSTHCNQRGADKPYETAPSWLDPWQLSAVKTLRPTTPMLLDSPTASPMPRAVVESH
jgi:hypothetical protein